MADRSQLKNEFEQLRRDQDSFNGAPEEGLTDEHSTVSITESVRDRALSKLFLALEMKLHSSTPKPNKGIVENAGEIYSEMDDVLRRENEFEQIRRDQDSFNQNAEQINSESWRLDDSFDLQYKTCRIEGDTKYVCDWNKYCCRNNNKCCESPETSFDLQTYLIVMVGTVLGFVVVCLIACACEECCCKTNSTKTDKEIAAAREKLNPEISYVQIH